MEHVMKLIYRIGVTLAVAPVIVGATSVAAAASESTGVKASQAVTCAGQLLGNPGFETGVAVPWTASADLIKMTSAREPAHGGSQLAILAGTGDPHTDTLSQKVTAPAGCRLTLSYWLHVDSDESSGASSIAYDALEVRVNRTFKGQVTNLDEKPGYYERTVDLSEFAGQDVAVSFSAREDAGLQTTFAIDDVGLTVS
jgi:hypothetical protein